MRSTACVLLIVVATAAVALSCGDPVHDDAVDALGAEADGVPPGPTHRPGQPCLTCHGGAGPASEVFVAAGTIYLNEYTPMTPIGSYAPLVNGTVHLVDAMGVTPTVTPTTNSVGNFYVTPDQWSPVFPIGAPGKNPDFKRDISVNSAGGGKGNLAIMTTQIDRGGMYASCGYCHTNPPGPTSPGHIYLN